MSKTEKIVTEIIFGKGMEIIVELIKVCIFQLLNSHKVAVKSNDSWFKNAHNAPP